MEIKSIFEFLDKNGLRGALIIAIFWLNNRLNTVENKLYHCLEERPKYNKQVYFEQKKPFKKDVKHHTLFFAVLHDPIKKQNSNQNKKNRIS